MYPAAEVPPTQSVLTITSSMVYARRPAPRRTAARKASRSPQRQSVERPRHARCAGRADVGAKIPFDDAEDGISLTLRSFRPPWAACRSRWAGRERADAYFERGFHVNINVLNRETCRTR